MRFSAGRQRLPRMRPSMLAFMWEMTYGFIFVPCRKWRSAGQAPADPIAHSLAHDQFEIAALQPGQLLGEHGHALPPGTGHPRDVGAPEHPIRTERVENAVQVLVEAAERVSVFRIAGLTG